MRSKCQSGLSWTGSGEALGIRAECMHRGGSERSHVTTNDRGLGGMPLVQLIVFINTPNYGGQKAHSLKSV